MSASHEPDAQFGLQHDSNRPTSIDLTLELERELDNESLPPTSPNPPRPQSLDPHVLASIVTQLRMSLVDVTRERDTLKEQLAQVQARDAGLHETLQHVTEKCIRVETDLENAADQRKEDEETISMLRSKVEESRRALMRLQTEKRMSVASNLTLDLSRPPPAHASLSGPPSSRRASFVPLTGSGSSAMGMGHRRISSVSDSGVLAGGFPEPGTWPPSPRAVQYFADSPDATPTDRAPAHNRRVSLLFGRGSVTQPEPAGDVELELLRKQLQVMQRQLDDSKRDLVEVQEAREASELCVKALRTFIAENNVGIPSALGSGRPTPPTHTKQGSTASRWGFRLWTSTEPESAKGAPTTPQQDTASPASTPVQTAPSKFGGLFTGRKSTSSAGPAGPSYDPANQEPVYNGSDTSSLPDSSGPISPASEVPHSSIGELGSSKDKAVVASLEHSQDIPVV